MRSRSGSTQLSLEISHGFSGSSVGHHPYYADLARCLPADVSLASPSEKSPQYWKKDLDKDKSGLVSKALSSFVDTIGMPNAWPVRSEADVLYCCQHLPLTRKRWVLDVDHPSALVRYHQALQRAPLARAMISRAVRSPRCAGIVFWSDAARRAFLAMVPGLPADVIAKMSVVYPSMPMRKRKRKAGNGYKILFVANMFEQKGGIDLLEAFPRLRSRHPHAQLTVVADLEDAYVRRYRGPGITFKARMPRERLYEEYLRADVFAYPTKMDIFGLVVLEALSFGLPVVTTRDFCTAEIVKDKETGIIIERGARDWFGSDGLMAMDCDYHGASYRRFVSQRDPFAQERLVRALDVLADPAVRAKFGRRIREDVGERFSVASRKTALGAVLARAKVPR